MEIRKFTPTKNASQQNFGHTRPPCIGDLNADACYKRAVALTKKLSPEDEKEAARLAKLGDRKAVAKLVESQLPLVVKIARMFSKFGVPTQDLIGEGNIGVMESIPNFDLARGTRFSTHAVWRIKKRIYNAVVEQSKTIKGNRRLSTLLKNLNQAAKEVSQMGEVTEEKLAEKMKISVDKLRDIQQLNLGVPVSLHTPTGEDGKGKLIDKLADETLASPLKNAENNELRHRVAKYLEKLNPKQRQAVELRFGFDGLGERTMDEIGEIMGATRQNTKSLLDTAFKNFPNSLKPYAKGN